MKKKTLFIICCIVMVLATSQVFAATCDTDSVVRQWITERNSAAQHLLKSWARGAELSDMMNDIAVILSNEFLVCSKCRRDTAFLDDTLLLLDRETKPAAAHVPAIMLEQYVGYEILSPWRQFPSVKWKGDRGNDC